MMLHNKRAVRDCSYGCCTEQISNRTLRAREKQAWVRENWDDSPSPFPSERWAVETAVFWAEEHRLMVSDPSWATSPDNPENQD